jgi:hypothetical protein
MFAGRAPAQTPSFSYYASNTPPQSPTAQGWIEFPSGAITTTALVDDQGFNAWQIDDDTSAEYVNYVGPVPDADRPLMLANGFTYRWRLRIPNVIEGNYARAIAAEAKFVNGPVSRRFGLQMGRSDTALHVSTYDGAAFRTGSVTVPDPDGYHVWTWFYHGTNGGDRCEVYVDSHQILAFTNTNADSSGQVLVFGSVAGGYVGVGNWNMVEIYKDILPVPKGPGGTIITVQ